MALDRHYPVNLEYGKGVYRRRVRLVGTAGAVTAVLNDDYHSMWCRLQHDGRLVTHVQAGMIRVPKSTCPGAIFALKELEGVSLSSGRRQIYGEGRPGRNCTHLLDLGFLAMGHVARGVSKAVIDVAIPDEQDGRTRMTADVDGACIHDWQIAGSVVQAPASFAGQSLFSGFTSWAEGRFAGLALDAARMLQKGAFVSRGRRYIVDQSADMRASDQMERLGDCYSFSSPQIFTAMDNLFYVRDFTSGMVEILPEEALSP